MKKITLILISVFIGSIAQSQQIPMFSQYYQTPFVYNPAYTGNTNNTNAFLINHSQWTDMPGSPVTRMI
ncbi:MAG: type IX secretion system membrane protein PorP/SprF, partial [Bacteroidota bacterium]